MKIDNERQLIVIEALRCYRDKLVSMKIDAKPVTEFLDEFRSCTRCQEFRRKFD